MAERERRVISLVGGGGKTTTMYALAEIFREEGKKVIVTTSTHLQDRQKKSVRGILKK